MTSSTACAPLPARRAAGSPPLLPLPPRLLLAWLLMSAALPAARAADGIGYGPTDGGEHFPGAELTVVAGNGDEGDLVGMMAGLEFLAAPRLGVTITPQLGLARGQNVEGDLTLLASTDLQFRWYPLHWGPASVFVEAGGGLQHTGPDSFPAAGSHANFRLRAGTGARLQLSSAISMLVGYNWLHMSNGNLLTPNVGHDGPIYFITISRQLPKAATPRRRKRR